MFLKQKVVSEPNTPECAVRDYDDKLFCCLSVLRIKEDGSLDVLEQITTLLYLTSHLLTEEKGATGDRGGGRGYQKSRSFKLSF